MNPVKAFDHYLDWLLDHHVKPLGLIWFLAACLLPTWVVLGGIIGFIMLCVFLWPLGLGLGLLTVAASTTSAVRPKLPSRKVERWPEFDASLRQQHIAEMEQELGIVPSVMSDERLAAILASAEPKRGRLLTPEQMLLERADAFFAQRSPEVLAALRCFATFGDRNVVRGSVWECPCHGDRWRASYGWDKPWYAFFRESPGRLYIPGRWGEPYRVFKRTIEWEKLQPDEYR